MKTLWDILRGMVIGLANIIPGVSGGTMMVSMGIYDTLIHSITHLFKEFKRSVLVLVPYAIGMVVAIVLGSFGLKSLFANYPLPTNTLFIGLILGSLPAILRQIKGEKIGGTGIVVFVLFFAVVIVLKVLQGGADAVIHLSLLEVLKLFLLGMLASATMVIPGVSGSMLLKTLGYYNPIVTGALPELFTALKAGDWALVGTNVGVLLPFGIGIVVGIFAIAKLIEVLLSKWKGVTYCAILGMVVASPVAILMDPSLMQNLTWLTIVISLVTFAVGFSIAWLLGSKEAQGASAHSRQG